MDRYTYSNIYSGGTREKTHVRVLSPDAICKSGSNKFYFNNSSIDKLRVSNLRYEILIMRHKKTKLNINFL